MRQEQAPKMNYGDNLPFDAAEITERDEIAKKYKVARPESLTKKAGKWYKDGIEVEEWEKMMTDRSGDAWMH
jgi:hypothetical protein